MKKLLVLSIAVLFVLSCIPVFAQEASGGAKKGLLQSMYDDMSCWSWKKKSSSETAVEKTAETTAATTETAASETAEAAGKTAEEAAETTGAAVK